MKERIITIFLLLLAGLTVWAITTELPKKSYARPTGNVTDAATDTPPVADEVIRLHIPANSDSEQDQTIKLALRDTLLPYLNAVTENAATKAEALALLNSQCPALTDIANTALEQMNAGYSATVSVKRIYFPIRIYGSQTYLSEDAVVFPPGYYDSVQVVLGQGQGHNWWCLAYPSLCFIDSAYDYVPKDSDIYKLKIGTIKSDTLEQLFYKEFPDASTSFPEDTSVCFSFKLWELLKDVFSGNKK